MGPLGRHSYGYANPDRIEYGFWLSFDSDGSMVMSRVKPGLTRTQRAMHCTAVLPLALFKTPELEATINVASPEAATEFRIDARAAAEALRGVFGVDVDLKINPAKGE